MFQSPCGEKVSWNLKDHPLVVVAALVSIPLRGKGQLKHGVFWGADSLWGVSIPLRGKGQLKQFDPKTIRWYCSNVSIPLRGKGQLKPSVIMASWARNLSFNPLAGKRSVETNELILAQAVEYQFQSPCGEKVSWNFGAVAASSVSTKEFQSPCGEKVSWNELRGS